MTEEGQGPRGVLAGGLASPAPNPWLCPLPTLPPSWEGFLEAGLVACFLLMLNIFSSPRTRCCSSSGRLWVREERWRGAVRLVPSLLPGGPPLGLLHPSGPPPNKNTHLQESEQLHFVIFLFLGREGESGSG